MDTRPLRWLLVILLLFASVAEAQPPSGLRVPTNPADRRTLTVTIAGTGVGVVTGPGISSCDGLPGGDCTEAYIVGTTTTIHATAASGSTFTGWSGSCSGTSVCTVTMSQARNVTATFTLTTFTLTVTGGAGGTVTSSPTGINCGADCTEPYVPATSVTLTASTSTGFTFTGWSGSGCSGTGTCVVSMTQARSVTATFAPGWNLAWNDNSTDETNFSLERRTPCNTGTYSVIAGSIAANTTTYLDSAVTAGVQYQYRIQALKTGAPASAYSNEVCTP